MTILSSVPSVLCIYPDLDSHKQYTQLKEPKKMRSPLLYLPLMALGQANAASWYFLTYYPPSGSQFVGFRGTMSSPKSIPTIGGTYYIWPGLQTTDNSGVYQNVLNIGDGSGSWWASSGWCCSDPSLPWGNGVGVSPGSSFTFNNFDDNNGNWTSRVGYPGKKPATDDQFPLGVKNFNQVVFAIELYEPAVWNFGPVEWTDVRITATGSDTSFCNDSPDNYYGGTNYTITGLKTSLGKGVVHCDIKKVLFHGPSS